MAQKRRQEREMRRRQRITTLLCIAGGLGAVLLSLTVCLLVFDVGPKAAPASAPAATALPYSAEEPFSLSDLTAGQQQQIRESGRISVSDGPRGICVGDSLDTLLSRFPSQSTQTQQSADTPDRTPQPLPQASEQSDEAIMQYVEQATTLSSLHAAEQTGEQSDEEVILYCADYFENQNGIMTALPPRGLLTTSGDTITVTLLAPTSPYPEGTQDSYGSYEHVYCVFTVQMTTMTVSSIVLGLSR